MKIHKESKVVILFTVSGFEPTPFNAKVTNVTTIPLFEQDVRLIDYITEEGNLGTCSDEFVVEVITEEAGPANYIEIEGSSR